MPMASLGIRPCHWAYRISLPQPRRHLRRDRRARAIRRSRQAGSRPAAQRRRDVPRGRRGRGGLPGAGVAKTHEEEPMSTTTAVETEVKIVDCDVHLVPRSKDELLERMP